MKNTIFRYIFLLFCIAALMSAHAQYSQFTVGETGTSSSYVPIHGMKTLDAAYHSQMVYPADSLTAMQDKLLHGLTYYTKNAATQPFDSRFVVKIGTAENDIFSSTTLLNNANFIKVYEGTLDASGETMAISFSNPYDYHGGNLVVDITIAQVGTVNGSCSFKGSPRSASSIMRCTGIAGRYDFMPRVTFTYGDLPDIVRDASHLSAVQMCYGSTGSAYEWNMSLEREDHSSYDTLIYTVPLSGISFSGSDTTIVAEHVMPRNLMGCADTERLSITLYRQLSHYVYDTVCQNYGQYTLYGLDVDPSHYNAGTRSFLTPESEWGTVYDIHCWDTTYLRLTINRSYKFTRNLNLCTSRLSEGGGDSLYYMYGDHRIDIIGPIGDGTSYMTDTIWNTTATGCDSLLILNISVSPSNTSDTTIYVRESELPYSVMGLVFNYATTRNRWLYNQYNCDSIVSVTLVLYPTYRDTTYIVGCGEYTWTVEGSTVAVIDHDTLASHLLTSSDNRDSVVYLRYTRGTINRTDTMVVACDQYTFKNIEYTASTNVYDTVPGVGMECDTQYTWQIRINHPLYRSETADVCDSIVWNGSVYRESTTDEYHYIADECENVDTLHLTVRYSSIGDTLVYAPQSFIYFDSTYNTSGDYVYVIPNTIGCDSIVTLHLYITPHNTPMPQLFTYEQKVLILNHYPYGDNTRVDYDSIYWEHDGVVMTGYSEYTYHLDDYSTLSGCYKVWVTIEGVWFPTNEVCMGNGIEIVGSDIGFTVSPNPVKSGEALHIGVTSGYQSDMTAAIYDLSGRIVWQQVMSGSEASVECDLHKGAYILRLKSGECQSLGKKIIVR